MTSLSKTRPSIHAAAASGQKSAFNNSTPVFLCASMIVGIVSLYAPAISAAPIYKSLMSKRDKSLLPIVLKTMISKRASRLVKLLLLLVIVPILMLITRVIMRM